MTTRLLWIPLLDSRNKERTVDGEAALVPSHLRRQPTIVGGGHGLPAGAAHSDRDAWIDYLASIVRAAETFGFTGALIPTGAWCEDAFVTAALLARETTSLAFLVAFRPGLVSPTLSAQMAATFARHAPGRILLNVVVGGEAHEQRSFGDHLDKDARYERCDEFLDVVRRLFAGETVTLKGKHVDVEEAALALPPNPVPPLYFGGSSPAAGPGRGAARRRLPDLGRAAGGGAQEDRLDPRARRGRGRDVRFGIRLHTISRDTADEAWAQADKFIDALDEETVRNAQKGLARSQSEGQRRMRELHEGQPRERQLERRPQPGDRAEPVGGRRPGARRRGYRAGRQSRRRGRPDRRVRRGRHRRVHLLRLPAPRGAVLVRRGRGPDPSRARIVRRRSHRRAPASIPFVGTAR